MRWGIGDAEDELARVRALRAHPPGRAGSDPDRRNVYGASLEQFEQLLRSAIASPPTTSPLPLFYAMSQAGRAIAAANHPDPVRWSFHGHGISGPDTNYPSPIGDTRLVVRKGARGAFRVVSEALGSPVEVESMNLGDLWASLPQLETVEGLGAGSLLPIRPQWHPEPGKADWTIETTPRVKPNDPVAFLKDHYPDLREVMFVVSESGDGLAAGVFQMIDGSPLDKRGESYLGARNVYLRPALNGRRPPSIFMTWWSVLFALSQLARYEPATWAEAINPDESDLTVPIEDGLRSIGRVMPQLVAHALTGRWP